MFIKWLYTWAVPKYVKINGKTNIKKSTKRIPKNSAPEYREYIVSYDAALQKVNIYLKHQ